MNPIWKKILRTVEVLGAVGMLSGTAVMAWQVPIVVNKVGNLPTKDWVDGQISGVKSKNEEQDRRITTTESIANKNYARYRAQHDILSIICFNARQHDLPINCMAKDRDTVWHPPKPSPWSVPVRMVALHDKRRS